MIELDFQLDPAFARAMDSKDLATASNTDLYYSLFCSDVFFRANGVQIDARWGWIPIVGFADQLLDSALAAEAGQEPPDVVFTESQDRITFRTLPDGRIRIEPSYSAERVVVGPGELADAARKFLHRVLRDLSQRWPDILRSAAFLEIHEKLKNAEP